jgi:hypothetical protein
MTPTSPTLQQLHAELARQNIHLDLVKSALETLAPRLPQAIPTAWMDEFESVCSSKTSAAAPIPNGALRG